MRVLVTAASEHGATAEIAEAIGRVLRGRGLDARVVAPGDVEGIDGYDAVVLGSAVYSGRWLAPARELVDRCGPALAARPVWLFSSGPVGDPSRALTRKMGEDPADLAAVREATGARDHRMFAGRLERRHLGLAQRAALTVVRGLEGDFRDWSEIERWAAGIADELGSGA
jgi:menaquinone-dependent protoporphyrinogen oxidase